MRRLWQGSISDVLETERIITVASGKGCTGQAIEMMNHVQAAFLSELLN
jgi:hypothetical protein